MPDLYDWIDEEILNDDADDDFISLDNMHRSSHQF